MSKAKIIICSFSSTDEIPGLHGRHELSGKPADKIYEQLKATVLKAGRFSVFEATQSVRGSHFFARLQADPDLELESQPFPWTGVKLKERCPTCGFANGCACTGGAATP